MPEMFVNAPNYRSQDWSWLSDLPSQFYSGEQQAQRSAQSNAFRNGIPTDAQGNPDYRAIMATLAQKGDVNAIPALAGPALQQQQTNQAQAPNALFSGFGQPGGAAPAAGGAPGGMPIAQGGAPAAAPLARGGAPALGAPVQSGQAPATVPAGGSVSELVASVLPNGGQTQTVATNIARALKVDPNTPLTPEQQTYAKRLVAAYTARTGRGAARRRRGACGWA